MIMWRLIAFLIVLIVSVWFGLEVAHHPGYLLIVYQPWMMQMPLWFAFLCVFVFLSLFYLILDSVDRVGFWWFRIKNWLHVRREQQSYSKTQQGLVLLIEGRWQKAERMLLAGVSQSVEPLINYLGAARAAQEEQAFDRRDTYIRKAQHVAPKASLAIGLTQAELEIERHHYEHAVATLTHLQQQSPHHPRVLKLLEKVYVRLADWQSLEKLLPHFRKAKLITRAELQSFEKNLYCEILRSNQQQSLEDLHTLWSKMPRTFKKNPDVISAYVQQLIRFPNSKETEELIRTSMKQDYRPELVKIYGSFNFDNINRQLVIVGAWLKMYGAQPELLVLLGKLCVKAQLWGKAKDYFQKCLAIAPHAEAALEYGKLLETLNEPEAARQAYRDGLSRLV
jgi:HemY protein